MNIVTQRLDLVPATVESLTAALDGATALAARLGADVPSTWPPEFLDRAALQFMMDRSRAQPDETVWWMYFMLLREAFGRRVLIGSAGYKGSPTEDGTVEIGYGIVADRHRQGFATEAARALIDRAFADASVRRVVAETLPELVGSIGVMRRCGLRFIGDGSEPGVIRFELTRAEHAGRDRRSQPAAAALTIELLTWIAQRRRTYGEAMAAWRSSCPRHPVWEDAFMAGLVEAMPGAETMRDAEVALTQRGWMLLRGGG